MPGMVPDPLSLWWERSARNALQVAYGHPGRYYGTIIAGPTERQKQAARYLIYSGDGWPGIGGRDIHPGRKARTRWCRAFVRALERVNKEPGFGRKIEWNVGVQVGTGRAFRVRTVPPGALRKPLDKPASQRWIIEENGVKSMGPRNAGGPAGLARRDWDING
jgi:hypothetical protein